MQNAIKGVGVCIENGIKQYCKPCSSTYLSSGERNQQVDMGKLCDLGPNNLSEAPLTAVSKGKLHQCA